MSPAVAETPAGLNLLMLSLTRSWRDSEMVIWFMMESLREVSPIPDEPRPATIGYAATSVG